MSDFMKMHVKENGKSNEVNILITGSLVCQDLLMNEKKSEDKDGKMTFKFSSSFSEMKNVLKQFDLTIGGVSSYNPNRIKGKEKQTEFNPIEFYKELRDSGFDVLAFEEKISSEDNLDYKNEYENLRNQGLLYTEKEEKNQIPYITIDINGIKIGIIEYTFPNKLDNEEIFISMKNRVELMRNMRVDFILCYINWAETYKLEANGIQQAIVVAIADLGVDYIVGAGTNTIQKYELTNSSWGRKIPTMYSLGRFLYCSKYLNRATSAVLCLNIKKIENRISIDEQYIPLFTFTVLGKEKYVVTPLNDKRYSSKKTNELVNERKSFVANAIGEDISISHKFDFMNKEEKNGFERKYNLDIIKQDSYLQSKIIDEFRISDEFRRLYGEALFSIDNNSDWINSAVHAIKKFKNISNVNKVEYKDLIIDLLYTKSVLGFRYYEYFGYEFEGKSIERRVEFIPEDYRLNYFRRINIDKKEIDLLDNKYTSYQRLKMYYKRDLIYISNKSHIQEFREFCKKHSRFIIKPVNGSLGQGIKIIDTQLYESNDKLFFELIKKSAYVCEELIKSSKYIEELHPASVNSIRVFTYNTFQDVRVLYAWLKIGRSGSIVDNGGAGGIVAALDLENGIVIANAGDENGNEFVSHPDTDKVIKGFKIEEWNELMKFVCDAAKEFPKVKLIAWDVAHSDKGWQIIEANSQGQINVYQLSTKEGIRCDFEEKIGWHNVNFNK